MPHLTPEQMRQLTDEEWAAYLREHAGAAPSGSPALAPSAPAISTGQAPPSLAAPDSSITAQLQDVLLKERAREAALSQAPGFGVRDALALGIAGAGDVASHLSAIRHGRGTPTNTFGDLLQARQKAEQARAAGLQESQKFQAEVLNSIAASNSRNIEDRAKAYAIVGDVIKSGAASPETIEKAIDEASGFMAKSGQDARMFGGLMRSLVRDGQSQVAVMLADYAPVFKSTDEHDQRRWKALEATTFSLVANGKPKEAMERIQAVVSGKLAPEVGAAAMETARNLRGHPQFKNGIPMAVLYDKFAGKYGPRGAQPFIDYLMGQLAPDEAARAKLADFRTAMVDAGFVGLDVAGAAQKAGAVRAAEQAETLQPEVRDLLKGRGIVNPDPKNPVDAAAIDAAIKEVEVTRPAVKAGATERAKLAPDIVAGEAARAGAIAAAQAPSQIQVAAATGQTAATRAQEFAQKKPVGAKDRSGYVDIQALQETGDLVQPPAGITQGDLDRSGRYAFIEDKQKEALRGLKRSADQISNIMGMADRVITARTGEDAIRQVINFKKEEYLVRNPAVKAFVDMRDAFLGNIARDLGGERGVLTEQDIGRVSKGFPSGWDTIDTKNLKKALIADVVAIGRVALIAEITGQPTKVHRRQLSELLDALEKIQSPGLEIESIRKK